MHVFLNGNEIPTQKAISLEEFIQLHKQSDTFAVAVNANFVPKTDYTKTQLQPGDHIDMVSPIQGG